MPHYTDRQTDMQTYRWTDKQELSDRQKERDKKTIVTFLRFIDRQVINEMQIIFAQSNDNRSDASIIQRFVVFNDDLLRRPSRKGCFGLAPAWDDSVWWSFICTIYSKTSLHIYNFLPSLAFTCSLWSLRILHLQSLQHSLLCMNLLPPQSIL